MSARDRFRLIDQILEPGELSEEQRAELQQIRAIGEDFVRKVDQIRLRHKREGAPERLQAEFQAAKNHMQLAVWYAGRGVLD